ncbi:MAG: histidine kinase N-terminal 7TM domain-containing protein [Clostridia bacterium]
MIDILIIALLIISVCLNAFLYSYVIDLKHKTKVAKLYAVVSLLLLIQCLAFLALKFCIHIPSINPVIFEYIGQLAFQFGPPLLVILAIFYMNPNAKSKYLYLLLLPSIFMIAVVWTNHYHYLYFASEYSDNYSNLKFGPLYIISTLYLYACTLVTIFLIFCTSKKRSGLMNKETLSILIAIFPLSVNVICFQNLVPNMPVYLNPICLTVYSMLLATVVLQYKLIDISMYAEDIALDKMKHPFLVIDLNGNLIQCNEAYTKTLGKFNDFYLFDNIIYKLSKSNKNLLKTYQEVSAKCFASSAPITGKYNITYAGKTYTYNVEISKISSKNNTTLGIFMIFKDITNHIHHLNVIKEQRAVIFAQDRLATIGKLASSFASDINIPMETIENGIVSLKTSNVFEGDELGIFDQMESCRQRISDIASNLVSSYSTNISNVSSFEVNTTISPIQLIVASELKKYDCKLIISNSEPIYIVGNQTRLSQVITNLVINAIQAYDTKRGGVIYLTILNGKSKVIINITDNAGGIPENIRPYLFKKIITSKGSKGTGLGLHLSNSIIKDEFNGKITFETDETGSTFSVAIPIKN